MFAKRALEEIPEENTSVWSCSSETCSGWMRDNFSFQTIPSCPFCGSTMQSGMKMLPTLTNHSLKRFS